MHRISGAVTFPGVTGALLLQKQKTLTCIGRQSDFLLYFVLKFDRGGCGPEQSAPNVKGPRARRMCKAKDTAVSLHALRRRTFNLYNTDATIWQEASYV